MSQMSNLHLSIAETLDEGELSFKQIAKMYGVSVKEVEMVYDDMMDFLSEQVSNSEAFVEDSDPYADGEALASAGWGTNEDYNCYEGDY